MVTTMKIINKIIIANVQLQVLFIE